MKPRERVRRRLKGKQDRILQMLLHREKSQYMILSYDIIIHSMTTISVPLPAHLLIALEELVKSGHASNKADAMRKALQKYVEEQAVEDVLRASKEPRLRGNLHALAKKL